MNANNNTSFIRLLVVLLLMTLSQVSFGAKRGRGKGNKKNMVNFPEIVEYSKVPREPFDPEGAIITRASHFHQTFKLGYKIVLICECQGPEPLEIKWYRDGFDIEMRKATHLKVEHINHNTIRSRLEIDPAAIGDAGTYTCIANNNKSAMAKSFKVEYS